ncbi:MAG: LytTR family DNA-binding domain-containing protein [Tenuifilaceae bacterium]|jgi:two-component system LytT family response regulator|nr:LytTR family DNA-binding domain-containing protein [Tenuifilaceae bacterium]
MLSSENRLKAVIIDDQEDIRSINRTLLSQNFPDIDVVGEADGVDSGIELILKSNPDLVLLDIEIKGGTGFNILQKIRPYNFMVIFITAFDEFAIKAIKFSAIDYILKPVNETEFCSAIENAITTYEKNKVAMQVQNLLDHVEDKGKNRKIVLRTMESIFLVDLEEVLYCESDNSYTTFYLSDCKQILVSKGIKEYEQMLSPFRFFRPHQRYLVNLNHVERIDKNDGGSIILKNKASIPISHRRKQALMDYLKG